MGIIQKAWDLQHNIENWYHTKRTNQKNNYQEFLKNPTRPLPGRKSITKARNICLLIVLSMNLVLVFQMFFFYDTVWVGIGTTVPLLVFTMSFMIFIFGLIFDYALFKRFGVEYCFMEW